MDSLRKKLLGRKNGRKELKYYIRPTEYLLLRERLKRIIKRDGHNLTNKGYKIKSLYFDTLTNKCYYEKQAGIEQRKKIRLRIYSLNDQKVKFELKKKINEIIIKETATITKKDAEKVQEGNFECLLQYKNNVLNKIYKILKTELLKPVIIIEYLRDAYVCSMNHTRITFDKVISANKINLNLFTPIVTNQEITKNNLIIMEIKYNGFLPKFIKDSIKIQRFTKTSISKYALGRLTDGQINISGHI